MEVCKGLQCIIIFEAKHIPCVCLDSDLLSKKSVYYCAIPLKVMTLSRYCVMSLLQFMTSLKVIALETLFLL